MDGWLRCSSLVSPRKHCRLVDMRHADSRVIRRDHAFPRPSRAYPFVPATDNALTALHQLYFQEDLTLLSSWYVNGKHYARTAEDWLKAQDRHREEGIAALECDAEKQGLGKEHARVTYNRSVLAC